MRRAGGGRESSAATNDSRLAAVTVEIRKTRCPQNWAPHFIFDHERPRFCADMSQEEGRGGGERTRLVGFGE